MKKLFVKFIFLMLITTNANGQLTMPAGLNKKAMVAERIGITQVQINYNRPKVNGREGHIWGELVHYGFADLHYGTSKAAPWRAGADENTTIEFSTDVLVEGQPLAAGKYGLFIAMYPEKATLIFSKANNAWGSFYYDEKEDALRVDVPVQKIKESIERLTYEFENQTDNSAVVALLWEKLKVPFKISVDLNKLQIESFRQEVNAGAVYQYWQNMNTAANYCLINNVNLEEALGWSDRSINGFFGEANFKTLSTHAGILEKLSRKKEADSLMLIALPLGKTNELFQYGYECCKTGRAQLGFDVFKSNYGKNPNDDYTILGMAMGYYALKNYDEALNFAKKGRERAVDPGFKGYYSTLITDMENRQNIFK